MHLYTLPASLSEQLLGTPDAPKNPDITIIARKPDDSAFLLLSRDIIPYLAEVTDLPTNDYVFTYRQEWGTNLSKDKLTRTINALRDEKLAAGFTFNGALYHCDEVFGSQLQAFVLAWQTGILPADATVSIRRKDNVTVQMGRDEVMALAAALMQYVQQVYAESWAAKDALG